MSKTANIYTGIEFLTKKQQIAQKAETKKANHKSFKNVENALKGAFKMLVNSEDKLSRDCANRCKSVFRSESEIIAQNYPLQFTDGRLADIKVNKEGVYCIKERKVTANNVKGILEKSIKNYIDSLGLDDYKKVIFLDKDIEITDIKQFRKDLENTRRGK